MPDPTVPEPPINTSTLFTRTAMLSRSTYCNPPNHMQLVCNDSDDHKCNKSSNASRWAAARREKQGASLSSEHMQEMLLKINHHSNASCFPTTSTWFGRTAFNFQIRISSAAAGSYYYLALLQP